MGVEDTVEVEVPEPDPIELAESKKQTDHPVGPKDTPSDPATLSNTMLPDKGPEAPVPTQLDTQQTLDPKDIDETKPGKGKAEKEQQFKEKKEKKDKKDKGDAAGTKSLSNFFTPTTAAKAQASVNEPTEENGGCSVGLTGWLVPTGYDQINFRIQIFQFFRNFQLYFDN